MVTQIENYDQVDVFVGLDVGKGEHHALADARWTRDAWKFLQGES